MAEILPILRKTIYNKSINQRHVTCKSIPIINLSMNCMIFKPHATSCGGYNVFDPSVSQSVSQSVRQSCFSCQRNSPENAQLNFVNLCNYEGHNVYIRICTGNFHSIFFSEYALFELTNLVKMKDTNETVHQRNSTGNCDSLFSSRESHPFFNIEI